MRVPTVRFTLLRLMIGIALCAVSLAFLRVTTVIAAVAGPLVGSIREIRKGGSGLTGGMIGGTITWVGLGLLFLVWECYRHPASLITADGLGWLLIVFAVYTIGGAVIGLAEGIAFYFARYLATLSKVIRLRAGRIARANSYGSTTPTR